MSSTKQSSPCHPWLGRVYVHSLERRCNQTLAEATAYVRNLSPEDAANAWFIPNPGCEGELHHPGQLRRLAS